MCTGAFLTNRKPENNHLTYTSPYNWKVSYTFTMEYEDTLHKQDTINKETYLWYSVGNPVRTLLLVHDWYTVPVLIGNFYHRTLNDTTCKNNEFYSVNKNWWSSELRREHLMGKNVRKSFEVFHCEPYKCTKYMYLCTVKYANSLHVQNILNL